MNTNTDTRHHRGTSLSAVALAVLGAGALVSMALASRSAPNGDLSYVVGGLVTGGAAGFSPDDLFLARPIVHRLYLGGIVDLVQALGVDTRSFTGVLAVRAAGWVTGLLASLVLWRGLAGRVDGAVAAWTSVAVALALLSPPNWYVLQPDWLGALLAVVGAGAALHGRGRTMNVLGPLLAGVAFTLALGAKVAALPWVLLALLVVAVLSPRRAASAAAAALVLTATAAALLERVLPWELRWMRDQVDLVSSSPLSEGISPANVIAGVRDSLDIGVVNPFVWAALAAAVVLVATRPTPGARLRAGVLVLLGLALSVGSGYGQGQHFAYHWAGMPVAAAGLFGWVLGSKPRAALPLAVGGIGMAVIGVAASAAPAPWRASNFDLTVAGFALLVALTGGAAIALSRRPRTARGRRTVATAPALAGASALAALAVSALAVAPVLPSTPYSFRMYNAPARAGGTMAGLERSVRAVSDLRAVVPPDARVLYLTYGALNFMLQNPATCRYPSPQWLQRATYVPGVRDMASYRDNLSCLTSEPAPFLAWDVSWFSPDRLTPEVREYVERYYDCSPSARRVLPGSKVWVCPRVATG